MRAHPRGTRFKSAFVICFHCERSSGKVSGELLPGKSFKIRFFVFPDTYNKTTTYHTLVLGHSICTRRRDYLHSGHDTRLCPDFKLSTTSVEICGRGVLTVTRLMANGGALLNSIMCWVSKEPDIIFLHCAEPEGCRCVFFTAFGVSLTAPRPVQSTATVWKHDAKFTLQESRRELFNDDGVHFYTQGQCLMSGSGFVDCRDHFWPFLQWSW